MNQKILRSKGGQTTIEMLLLLLAVVGVSLTVGFVVKSLLTGSVF